MSLLSQTSKGKIQKPYFVTIFGPTGVGKSTFGAEAPSAIFACTEDGSNHLDVNRLPRIESFQMMMDAIKELTETKHNYKTLVVDSLDHLEPLVWKQIVIDANKPDIKNVEDFGYGKGYILANAKWEAFFYALKNLREKMNVVLVCHSQVKSFNDPSLPAPYDRYELKLHKGANALVRENCDAILFATYSTVINIDKNTKRAKGFGGDERVIYTEYRAHHDGKNRLGLPYQIELSYKAFNDAVQASDPESGDVLVSQITGILTKLTDPTLKEKATAQFETAKAANDIRKLGAIKARLEQVLQ